MDNKTYYDRILEDVSTFDKIIFDLEKMEKEGANARIRTVAATAIANIKLAQEICSAVKKAQ